MVHLNQPTHDAAVPGDKSESAVKTCIALFCDTAGVEPVKLATRKGEMRLTDELIGWCRITGASLDWITIGDVTNMVRQCCHSRAPLMPQVVAADKVTVKA
ncbi:MAG: hypothetical protein ABI832_11630 [bacterium]